MKSILDKDFRYTPSAATNLKVTFARIRREQKQAEESRKPSNVEVLTKKKHA